MILNITQKFKHMKIRRKITIMYFVGLLTPIILLFFIFFINLINESNKRETLAREDAIERVFSDVTTLYNDMNQVAIYYSSDMELFQMIERKDLPTTFDIIHNVGNINNHLLLMNMAFSKITKIELYHSRLNFQNRDYVTFIDQATLETEWYQEYAENDRNFIYYTRYNKGEMNLIMISRLSINLNKNSTFIMQSVKSEDITESLTDGYFAGSSVVYLLDPDNMIVASSNDIYRDNNEIQFFDESAFSRERQVYYLPLQYKNLTDDWKIVFCVEQPSFLDSIGTKLIMTISAMIIIVIVSLVLVQVISMSFTKRLVNMSEVMKSSQGKELIKIELDKSDDEIGIVITSYNTLINRIEKLLYDVQVSKDHIEKLLMEKIEAYEELEALNEELATANQELTTSFEEIRVQDIRIEELIYKDMLTGLNNRFSISNIIEKHLYTNKDSYHAIIFIDVDNFKFINDTYGHDIGDIVIKETGMKLMTFESENIEIGRFGGDEFLIYIKVASSQDEVIKLLGYIKNMFTQPIAVEDKRFYLTISMGVAEYPNHGTTRNELIKKADMALYKSKETGKDRYTFYDKNFDHNLERKIHLQNCIKEAIIKNEFYLNYQPVVNIESEKIKGYEALLRWNNDMVKQTTILELVKIAEEMSAIIDIGDWVMETAFQFIKKVNLSRGEKLTISVNVSAVQLMDNDFVSRLVNITNKVGINPEVICLEVTETVFIDSFSRCTTDLIRIRDLGYGIALDDFGTGFSSLSYFRDLPITMLKIDKSFVDEIIDSKFNSELVHFMAVIAHNLGINVIAEGVETKKQLEILKRLECDFIQGYYFSKPLCDEDAINYGL